MRWLIEFLMRVWPVNRLMLTVWRYTPFPRGARSLIMRGANDSFLIGVVLIVEDGEGRVMLVRNTYESRYSWSLPGGWMGRNEQPTECIQRELREETGYAIAVEELLDARTQSRLPSVDLVYRGRIAGGEFRPSVEVAEARFFPVDDLPEGLMVSHRRLLTSLWSGSQP